MDRLNSNRLGAMLAMFAGVAVAAVVGDASAGQTGSKTQDTAIVEVIVRAFATPLVNASVALDLNSNGVWEPELGEPQDWTDTSGVVVFGGVVPILPDSDSGEDALDWRPSRIVTGNLRGTVGAREVHLDFVLPSETAAANLSLYDLKGRRLAGTQGTGDLALNVPENLPAGVYFLRLSAEPSAPVTHRITSVGTRARTVRAHRLSSAEAVAAGWLGDGASGRQSGSRKSPADGQQMNLLLSHPEYGEMIRYVFVMPGFNSFTANMGGLTGPYLVVMERYLGMRRVYGVDHQYAFDIAGGQRLNFAWAASPGSDGGSIASFRWGWNLADPDDPDDPGWALPPGMSPEHQQTSPDVSFAGGVQRLTIQVANSLQRISRLTLVLSVVPIPDLEQQLPLLLVDDVNDRTSSGWLSQFDQPLDNDVYRDAFWRQVLEGPGGVVGWNPSLHVVDTEEDQLGFRDVINYRSLVWLTRFTTGDNSYTGINFRPSFDGVHDIDKHVWLAPYQQLAGNVLYAGSQGLFTHLAEARYEVPVVFESTEMGSQNGMVHYPDTRVRRSFGVRYIPQDTEVLVGPTRYPFDVAGVSVLDVMSVVSCVEYGSDEALTQRRRAACVGLKGVALDAAFKVSHFPGGAAFADTIWTEPQIDWRDLPQPHDPYLLGRIWPWGQDEFYNGNVVGRPTPYTIQQCDGEPCVEPMFRSIARYDWIRQTRLAADPDDTWPVGYYDVPGQPTLVSVCGTNALTPGLAGALTNDQVVAFVARKTASDKPSQVGDVVMGFDPYRFDNQQMRAVIRWVLGEHFGLTMNPGR